MEAPEIMEAHTSETSESKFKKIFEEKLRDYEMHHQGSFRRPWTNERILEVISNVKNARVSMTNTECRTSMSYYWISKYDLMTTGSEEYLIFKRKSPDDPVIRIVPREEYFTMLNTIHKDCGHGGRDKMVYNIKSRFYIAKKAVEIFVSLCPTCNTKRNIPRKGIVTRPIVSQDFNIRGQVDLIDFQSCPDGYYKWLLNYQDNATKFLNLRPLKTKMASEVATELMKIFLIFGAPYILQSDNGREFTAKIIEELVAMWPECKIVHGSPRRPQTQGSVERSNQDVENMIRSWMTDNNSTNWSVGCFFCQYQKNASFHRIIGRSPYKALFGADPKAGLTGTSIPFQLLSNIETEEDLRKLTDDEPQQRLIETTTSNMSMVQNDVNKIATTSHGHPIITEDCENPNAANKPAESNDGTESYSERNQINYTGIIQVCEVETHDDYNPANSNKIDKYLEILENIEPNLICAICQKPTTGAHSCKSCNNAVHVTCGLSEESEEGYGSKVLCLRCKSEENILLQRSEAHKSLKRAAEKMVENTAKKLPLLSLGNSVLISVPKVDRGPLDTKNIKGKIVDFRNGVYRVGTKTGILKNWFVRQELHLLQESYDDIISNTPISLREAVTNESKFGGQGFQKCSCKPAQKQCRTMRCACFKKKVLCGSKCHSSLSCVNK